VELSNRLINRLGCSIVLTGVEKEKKTISIIKKHINSNVYDSSGLLTLKELAAVIANSNLFVGPSTGPMHMAVALSVPVVALFSPIRVQSAKRWGPFGKNTEVVAPDVKCEENFKCSEYKCSHYDCMNTIKVDKVFEKALQVYAKNEESEQVGLYF
jgi:ADP-heptose:LPS heptosyltransferase